MRNAILAILATSLTGALFSQQVENASPADPFQKAYSSAERAIATADEKRQGIEAERTKEELSKRLRTAGGAEGHFIEGLRMLDKAREALAESARSRRVMDARTAETAADASLAMFNAVLTDLMTSDMARRLLGDAMGQRQQPDGRTITARTAPPVLRTAIDSYLHARYSESIALLTGIHFDEARIQAQVELFRAAANFALYRATGEDNEALLDRATASAREARRLDATLVPLPDYFSPAFRRLFATVRTQS